MTDTADAMSVEDGTAVNVHVSDFSDNHQKILFVINEQIEDPDIPVHGVRLSHVTSPRASFCMYGFDFSRGPLSVMSHTWVCADDMTTSSTGGITAGRQVVNNGDKVLLLDGRHCLQVMRQLHVRSDVGRLQQHRVAHPIVMEARVATCKGERIELS